MDDVREQLKQLNTEVAALAVKVEAAREAWLSATDTLREAKLKEVYNDLKEKEKQVLPQLLDARRALEAKLPGAGERSMLSVLISPWFCGFKISNVTWEPRRVLESVDCARCQPVASLIAYAEAAPSHKICAAHAGWPLWVLTIGSAGCMSLLPSAIQKLVGIPRRIIMSQQGCHPQGLGINSAGRCCPWSLEAVRILASVVQTVFIFAGSTWQQPCASPSAPGYAVMS